MNVSASGGKTASTPIITVKDVQAFKARQAERAAHNRAELETARASKPETQSCQTTDIAGSGKAAGNNAASALANMLSGNPDDMIGKAKASAFEEANTRFVTVLASEHYATNEKLAQVLLAKSGMSSSDIIEALSATANRDTLQATAEALAEEREAGQREGMKVALSQTSNSNIDASGFGSGAGGKADKAKADSDAWDKVYAAINPQGAS